MQSDSRPTHRRSPQPNHGVALQLPRPFKVSLAIANDVGYPIGDLDCQPRQELCKHFCSEAQKYFTSNLKAADLVTPALPTKPNHIPVLA